MDLFLDTSFSKEAAFASRLSENAENWPQELTSELFKQLPYLSDYDVNVNLAKVEPQRGFGFGYADISNKTERPEIEHTEVGLPHVRIPLVVQERAVKPFSIFLDGEKVMPLTEERIREILFNPGTFDLSTSQPMDPSLVEPLMPPQRSGMGMGGEYKMASVKKSGVKDTATRFATEVGSGAVKNISKKYAPHAAAGVAGTAGVVGGAAYAGARAGAKKSKTATMIGMPSHYEGDGGVAEVVERWLEELKKHNSRPLEKEAMVKEAFNHMSKPQWDAIYKSDAVQKLVAKNGGTISHPEVTNKVYEMAAKTFGFHPKVYSKPPQVQAQQAANKQGQKPAQQKPSNGAQKTASLLLAIAPTIHEADRDAFVEKVAADPTLQAGFTRSGIASTLVEALDNTKRASASEMLLNLADRIEPTAVTIQKLPGGDFLFKSANVNAFSPQSAQGQVVPGQEAAEAIGPEAAQAMQPGQVATAVADPVEEAPLYETNEKVCDEFGEWLVQDEMGNRLMGWVFPQTLSWDGEFTPQPIALFTNGSAYALQDTIAGELVGKGVTFPSDAPRGDGVFYATDGGKAICTAPITVGSASMGPDGSQSLMGQDVFGNPVQIHMTEGISKPTRVSDVEYALPKTWKFMRLNNQTQLATDPVQMNKAANVRAQRSEATLFFNGAFNLEGGCGLGKLASSLRYDLDPVSAEFMLGVLGLDGRVAKQKVAEARRKGSVKLAGLKTITLLAERYLDATKVATAIVSEIPNLKKDLLKEAAAMDDEATVDNLLALNFINPENVGIFVSYIPDLEHTSEKLAEMLLSSYLGMRELPEGAMDRGMKNLEETISSLKALHHASA